jgi:hypothetical protein
MNPLQFWMQFAAKGLGRHDDFFGQRWEARLNSTPTGRRHGTCSRLQEQPQRNHRLMMFAARSWQPQQGLKLRGSAAAGAGGTFR